MSFFMPKFFFLNYTWFSRTLSVFIEKNKIYYYMKNKFTNGGKACITYTFVCIIGRLNTISLAHLFYAFSSLPKTQEVVLTILK